MRVKFILLTLFWAVILHAKPLEVTLAYENENNPPYALGDGKLIDFERPGITIELLKEIEKKLNIKISFKRVPWKRAILMLQTGHVDGLFHASFKEKRAKFATYPMDNKTVDTSKAIMTNSYYLYKNRQSKLLWDGSRFTQLDGKIGIIKGFSIIDTIKDLACIDLCNNLSSCLNKLKLSHIEGIINLENRVDTVLLSNPKEYKNIQKIAIPIQSKPYYLIFSKKFYYTHKETIEQIWSHIKIMREDGTYDKIKAKYFTF